MSNDIEKQLALFGIQPNRRGSAQMCCVLEQLLQNRVSPSLTHAYAATAKRFGVRAAQVERNLHAVIARVWETADEAVLRSLMPWRSGGDPPGNREFLCTLAAHMRIAYAERAYQERLREQRTEAHPKQE